MKTEARPVKIKDPGTPPPDEALFRALGGQTRRRRPAGADELVGLGPPDEDDDFAFSPQSGRRGGRRQQQAGGQNA